MASASRRGRISTRSISASPDAALTTLLGAARTIAVVGLSPDPGRPSHSVARYLQRAGYRIVPVNPFATEILGEQAYPTITSAATDHAIDIVDVFRRSVHVRDLVREAIPLSPRLIWLQQGVRDDAAAALARAAGIPFVMDRCLAVEHDRLISPHREAE
ncbi:MAG TPA: CoA-binding protein [Gemmatimonadales bacterium]|nr:CoA-binding protein [Gemmatimonadales bacterium]